MAASLTPVLPAAVEATWVPWLPLSPGMPSLSLSP